MKEEMKKKKLTRKRILSLDYCVRVWFNGLDNRWYFYASRRPATEASLQKQWHVAGYRLKISSFLWLKQSKVKWRGRKKNIPFMPFTADSFTRTCAPVLYSSHSATRHTESSKKKRNPQLLNWLFRKINISLAELKMKTKQKKRANGRKRSKGNEKAEIGTQRNTSKKCLKYLKPFVFRWGRCKCGEKNLLKSHGGNYAYSRSVCVCMCRFAVSTSAWNVKIKTATAMPAKTAQIYRQHKFTWLNICGISERI